MNQEQLRNMATQCLSAFSDERGLMPMKYHAAITDLSKVLLGIATGQLVIEEASKPDSDE